MAEFCKKCLEKEMGIKKTDKYYKLHSKFWLVKEGGICEGCGYKYLNNGDKNE